MGVLRRQGPLINLSTDPAYYTWSVQPQLRAICLSLMILALVAVLTRVYIRIRILRVFRLDDYFIVLAMAFSVASSCIFLHVVMLGMGRHIWAIPPHNLKPLLMYIFIVGVLVPLSVCFVKLSIAFFLFPLTKQTRFRQLLWAIIVFLVIFTLFTFFTLIFSCTPVQANWDFELRGPPIGKGSAKCLPIPIYKSIALFNSITNIVTDVVLALIPIPLIWSLQVNKRTKASLIFILSLGFFACAAAIIKTPLLYHFFDNMDSTGTGSWYYAWQIIEMNVGILAATLPSIKPAFRWLLETARNFTAGVSGNRTGSNGYKRHSSIHYSPRREHNAYETTHAYKTRNFHNSNDFQTSALCGPSMNVEVSKGEVGVGELELKRLNPYNVEVAGDDKSGKGTGENDSMDAILRADSVEGETRGIVRTTKVTIVTE